jgi:trafficking protein particle complex subunit 6
MAARISLQGPAVNLTTPNLASLADPPTRYVDGAAMDYFLIELVNTLRASSAVATARAKKIEQEMIDEGLIPAPAPTPAPVPKTTQRESVASNTSRSAAEKSSVNADEEGLRTRLEAIGMHVGANFTER